MRVHRAVHALLFGLSVAAGCSAPAGTPQGSGTWTYIGELQNSDVRIALVRDDATFVAYLCGTGDTLLTHTRWFGGPLGNGRETEISTDEFRLRFWEDEDRVSLSGQLESAAGETLTWRAALREEDASEVGLYETRESGCRSGVIVWQAQPGPACGAQGSFCDAQGQRGQVTPVACAPGMPITAKATLGDETFEFVATRVEGP